MQRLKSCATLCSKIVEVYTVEQSVPDTTTTFYPNSTVFANIEVGFGDGVASNCLQVSFSAVTKF